MNARTAEQSLNSPPSRPSIQMRFPLPLPSNTKAPLRRGRFSATREPGCHWLRTKSSSVPEKAIEKIRLKVRGSRGRAFSIRGHILAKQRKIQAACANNPYCKFLDIFRTNFLEGSNSCHFGPHGQNHKRLRSPPNEYRDRIEIGGDAAHRGNSDQREEQRGLCGLLTRNSQWIWEMRNNYRPTCSAFSTLRRIFEGLSGPGN